MGHFGTAHNFHGRKLVAMIIGQIEIISCYRFIKFGRKYRVMYSHYGSMHHRFSQEYFSSQRYYHSG